MFTFFRESSVWPFVHCLINGSLYTNTRNWPLSIALMYVWESIELVVSGFLGNFVEAKDDSLLGDPLVGFLVITALYVIDRINYGDAAFVLTVPGYIRLLCFLTHGIIATVVGFLDADAGLPVVIVGVLYIAASLAFYLPYLYSKSDDSLYVQLKHVARVSEFQWLYFVGILTLVAAARNIPSDRFPYNTYVRVVGAESVYFSAALVLYAVVESRRAAYRYSLEARERALRLAREADFRRMLSELLQRV